MNTNVSAVILRTLLTDRDYARRYLPFLQGDYFSGVDGGPLVLDEIKEYVGKYDAVPTKEEIVIEINNRHGDIQEKIDKAQELAETIDSIAGDPVSKQWLDDQTRDFIARSYEHATMLEMIHASTGGKSVVSYAQRLLTPPMLDTDAPGLDSTSDGFYAALHEHLTKDDARIDFDISWLNRTVRGVKRQTLNVILAPTNHGKSLMMCHLSASYLRKGLNVLYISLEMDSLTVAVRIHANLFDTAIEAMERWSVADYRRKAASLKGNGRLIVRDYPTGTAHAGHFRAYLEELKRKANFAPDVVVVDYLNVCGSERMNGGGNTPLYQLIGSISKELRALAQQTDTVCWTATQTNRAGLEGNVKLSNTSDSMQTAFDADLVIGMWKDEGLPGRLSLVISKDRNGASAGRRGLVGVDTSRMKITDLTEAESSQAQAAMQKLAVKGKKQSPPHEEEIIFDIDKEAA